MKVQIHTFVAEAVKLIGWMIPKVLKLAGFSPAFAGSGRLRIIKKLQLIAGASLLLGVGLLRNLGAEPEFTRLVSVVDLRCERLESPLAIDFQHPRLSWKLDSELRNVDQVAYRVCVASSPELLENGGNDLQPDLWDSDRIESGRSVWVPYEGKSLRSLDRCYWKVKVWTNHGESEWSPVSQWTMGLLYQNEWQGRWIGFDRAFEWDDVSQFSRLSARYFRKEFELQGDREIERATVFLMGLGLYELHLNGAKVGSQVLSPSPTDFGEQVKYNTFDVTTQLKSGENALGVVLGNGRFFTMRQNYKPYKIKTFGFPKLLLNLVVEYADGFKEVISTDDSWKGTADGPIRSNNEYDGEEYDARKEMPGWSAVGFDDGDWLTAEWVQEPGGDYRSQLNANMEIVRELRPVGIHKLPGEGEPRYVIDMGQNFAGWVRMQVVGKRGDVVTLRFAESLDKNGELMTEALRDAKATDRYVLKGDSFEVWEPTFVYHGFRYVEVIGYPGEPTLEHFTGCLVADPMEQRGRFESSNKLANQILENAKWSILSNYKGMPIDCPQRNERMPWLGDRAMGCFGESLIFDNYQLYRKWLEDIHDSQKADGSIADVAPTYFRYYSDNMSWPGTYLFVAEMLRNQFGDEGCVREHYASMKKWLLYMESRYSKEGILTRDRYGDWCAPPASIEEGRGKNADVKHPNPLIATAYFYHCLQLMQEFAQITDEHGDIEAWNRLAGITRTAFHREYFDASSGGHGGNTQTENLLALAFELVPDEQVETVVQSLKTSIVEDHDGHLSTGLIGVQWLMCTLTKYGLHDVAMQLLNQTTYPSWGYMVEQGATTIWELWNADTAAPNMNSQNHVMMLGDLIPWMFESGAGIQIETGAFGYRELRLEPAFWGRFEWVEASLDTDYGIIVSNWNVNSRGSQWEVEVPCNTMATVVFPEGVKIEDVRENGNPVEEVEGVMGSKAISHGRVELNVGSGHYQFEILKGAPGSI